jgi:hypothetical protein
VSEPDKRADIARLLAEADTVLGSTRAPVGADRADVGRAPAQEPKALPVAVLAAGLAAGIVFVMFSFLPFLGAPSGAVAAFASTLVTVLVLRGVKRWR